MAQIRIGLSGYSYPDWQGEGLFYPPKLPKSKYLSYYGTRYKTVEGVGMFTRMPADSTVVKTIKECPADFHLSPKMHQSVTHFKRLKPESVPVVEDFLATLKPLEDKGMLGPVLLQLPPNFAANHPLLEQFLEAIPHRDSLKWAIEFRNASWQTKETEDLLRNYKVGWVADDTDDADAVIRETTDHLYIRLRKTDYSDDQLKEWGSELKARGVDCYVYVRHLDVEAPWRWADRLLELT